MLGMQECHHFDLEAECPNDLCPNKAVCRRVRQEAGSTAIEPSKSWKPVEVKMFKDSGVGFLFTAPLPNTVVTMEAVACDLGPSLSGHYRRVSDGASPEKWKLLTLDRTAQSGDVVAYAGGLLVPAGCYQAELGLPQNMACHVRVEFRPAD